MNRPAPTSLSAEEPSAVSPTTDTCSHKCRTAVFPGSFNPFTTGHLDIVERGLKIFDRVIVAIGYNEHKSDNGDLKDRLETIRKIFADRDDVDVAAYSGLTVEFARSNGACAILRGVRNAADFEYERTLADTNAAISEIDTVILATRPELSFVSSSMVRELDNNGYDVSPFLPAQS